MKNLRVEVKKRLEAISQYAEGLPEMTLQALVPALDSILATLTKIREVQNSIETGKIEIRLDKVVETLFHAGVKALNAKRKR